MNADQISDVLTKLEDHDLYPIVALALATGMRRGELLALRWLDVDLDSASVKVKCFARGKRQGPQVQGSEDKARASDNTSAANRC